MKPTNVAYLLPLGALVALTSLSPAPALAQRSAEVTYSRDVAPILQRSCERCHRANSLAPMSLQSYQEARRWASRIKERTQLRGRPGVMPPWFVERDIGIQHFANDEALTEQEIGLIAAWADNGAPEGDPRDLPRPLEWPAEPTWDIGEPDLIVDLPPITMEANAPDWWGMLQPATATGLQEDRYVAAMQVLEISDVEGGVGGNFIFHHALLTSTSPNGGGPFWPVHEVGRNAQYFDAEAPPLLRAGSAFFSPSVHMHANERATTAHLRLGFKLHPRGYAPTKRETMLTFGNGEIDLAPMRKGQEVHVYHTLEQNIKVTSFEPHMHASGVRMCLEAIWGGRTETLSCVGYDHDWVKVYNFDPDHAPLLPAGTLVHVIAYFDTTEDNDNVVDPRNWQGLGHRSIDNMAITFLPGIMLSDEEFAAEILRRREVHGLAEGEAMLGCPLCGYSSPPLAQQ